MTSLEGAFVDEDILPITVDSIIFDSGSSINHIPTREYNLLLNYIMREHECITIMNPLETYYCECTGMNDASFPELAVQSGLFKFNLRPSDYLLYERVDSSSKRLCMISFQE